jgi:phosphate transport system substrate-binding protein
VNSYSPQGQGTGTKLPITNRRAIAATVAVTTILILLDAVGCGSASSSDAASDSLAPTSAIGAAGSTFVAPLMSNWISGYQRAHPRALINYRPIGSGGGIDEFKKGLLAFAASDAPLTDDEIKDLSPTIQMPGTAGPVCIIYNLPGLAKPLRLSPTTLAGIYLGTIISWQDPAIVRDNPGVMLPRAAVVVIHRSDGSGTTNILTTYLSRISKDWKSGHGLSVTWPMGLGADGSKGVLDLVKQSPGTVGYLELNYAKENAIPVAAIENRAGAFVDPTPNSTAAAIEAFEPDLVRDIRSPIVDPPASAKSAYPIAGLTFLLVPKDRTRKDEQIAVKDFIAYAISTGQESAEQLSYAKLPPSVQQKAQALLTQLTANGQPLQ